MIEELRKNVETEIQILREISSYISRLGFATPEEKRLLIGAINSLKKNLRILNNSIPNLLKGVSVVKKLPSKTSKASFEKIQFKRSRADIDVTIEIKDRKKFLEELSISENLIRKLKRKKKDTGEEYEEFQAARGYLKLANKFFLNRSIDLINKGYFRSLSIETKKANINILLETYVAMIIFSSLLGFFVGLIVMVFLLFISLSFVWPIFSLYDGSILIRLAQVFWVPLVLPGLVFFVLYIYPSSEKKSIAKQVEQELPFAVIHMSAISGSGIEPSEIFKIIGLSKEYPALRKEIRKILNQINLYGYDLVTALTNVSKTTPSPRLAELFSGLSTTIHSGGDLKDFFEKRAETLLVSYRLDREKYTRVAETFMDIYISVVIAAPMILMLLLIMISISGIAVGFTPTQMTTIIIGVIGLVNLLFLGFLHVRQPSY